MTPFFQFVYIVDSVDGNIEISLHAWDEAYLILMDDVFDVFLGLFCEYFIEYFCVIFRKRK